MLESDSTRHDSSTGLSEDYIHGDAFQAPDEVDAGADPDPLAFGNPTHPN